VKSAQETHRPAIPATLRLRFECVYLRGRCTYSTQELGVRDQIGGNSGPTRSVIHPKGFGDIHTKVVGLENARERRKWRFCELWKVISWGMIRWLCPRERCSCRFSFFCSGWPGRVCFGFGIVINRGVVFYLGHQRNSRGALRRLEGTLGDGLGLIVFVASSVKFVGALRGDLGFIWRYWLGWIARRVCDAEDIRRVCGPEDIRQGRADAVTRPGIP